MFLITKEFFLFHFYNKKVINLRIKYVFIPIPKVNFEMSLF